jgi:hypothetical protein
MGSLHDDIVIPEQNIRDTVRTININLRAVVIAPSFGHESNNTAVEWFPTRSDFSRHTAHRWQPFGTTDE